MGVNPTAVGYSPYDEIIEKLVARGIPREQIAAIGDAESDAKKQALFEKVRQGSVRVLIGSTQKMGTGTNVQKRLVALHHLDAPWKPAEVEQREGRILRQGNENEEVAIYRYVTEGSFDAYMWQALETKARFIGQVMTGDNAARRAEDIGGQELSYAEVKAIASGNPAVLTLAEADAELQRLTLLKKNHLDEQYVARRSVRDLPATIASLSERLSKLTDGPGHRERPCRRSDHHRRPDVPTRRRTRHSRRQARRLAEERPRDDPRSARHLPRPAFRHRASSAIRRPKCTSKARPRALATLSRDHQGPRAVLNALERLAGGYGSECDRVRQDLAIAEVAASRLPGPPGQAFPARRLPGRTDHACVTSSRPAFPARPRSQATRKGRAFPNWPSRSRRSKPPTRIEATPQRDRQKHSSAEEPVTARIRRRTEAVPASDLVTESDVAPEAEGVRTQGSTQNSSLDPPRTFQERIILERQRKDDGPSPP